MEFQLPSQHILIPNLGVLDRLLLAQADPDRVSAMQRETEQLPYYLRGAVAALIQLEYSRGEAIKVLSHPIMGGGAQVLLSPDQVDPLSFAMDSYLHCMRRSFDALCAYVRRSPGGTNLPASMNKLIKGIRSAKFGLDPQLEGVLSAFWDDVGYRIKGYRDQTSHKAIIVSNCIVFNSSNGAGLRMLMPDDPQETSPSKLRYDAGVPAMGFALDALEKTLRCVNQSVERMIDLMSPGDPNARDAGVVGPAIRGGPLVIGGRVSGEPVPFPLSVAEAVSRATRGTDN